MGSETAPEDGSFEFPSYQYCTEGEVAPWDGEDSPQLTYETVALMEEDGHSDSSTTTTPEAPTAGAHAGHSSGVAGVRYTTLHLIGVHYPLSLSVANLDACSWPGQLLLRAHCSRALCKTFFS